MKLARLFLFLILFSFVFSCENNQGNSRKDNNSADSVAVEVSQLEILNEEIKKAPKSSNNYYQRAMYFKKAGNLEGALKDLDRALVIDSTVSVYHSEIGNIQYLFGNVEGSRNAFYKALEYDEENTQALMGLAEIFLAFQNYGESMKHVNTALRIDERLYKGYFLKGFIYKETGDTSLALSSFRTAVEVNPEFYEGYMMLGLMHQRIKDPIALEYYNSALNLRPESKEAILNRGLLYQEMGRADEAIAEYDVLIQQDSSDIIAWYNSGYVYLVLKEEPENAIRYFSRAVELYPNYHEAYYNRGLSYEMLENFNEALSDYQKALEINPQYDPAALGMSRVLEGS